MIPSRASPGVAAQADEHHDAAFPPYDANPPLYLSGVQGRDAGSNLPVGDPSNAHFVRFDYDCPSTNSSEIASQSHSRAGSSTAPFDRGMPSGPAMLSMDSTDAGNVFSIPWDRQGAHATFAEQSATHTGGFQTIPPPAHIPTFQSDGEYPVQPHPVSVSSGPYPSLILGSRGGTSTLSPAHALNDYAQADVDATYLHYRQQFALQQYNSHSSVSRRAAEEALARFLEFQALPPVDDDAPKSKQSHFPSKDGAVEPGSFSDYLQQYASGGMGQEHVTVRAASGLVINTPSSEHVNISHNVGAHDQNATSLSTLTPASDNTITLAADEVDGRSNHKSSTHKYHPVQPFMPMRSLHAAKDGRRSRRQKRGISTCPTSPTESPPPAHVKGAVPVSKRAKTDSPRTCGTHSGQINADPAEAAVFGKIRVKERKLGKSRTGRRQYTSCDSCRASKKGCDLRLSVVLNTIGVDVHPEVSCSSCKRRGLKCTTKDVHKIRAASGHFEELDEDDDDDEDGIGEDASSSSALCTSSRKTSLAGRSGTVSHGRADSQPTPNGGRFSHRAKAVNMKLIDGKFIGFKRLDESLVTTEDQHPFVQETLVAYAQTLECSMLLFLGHATQADKEDQVFSRKMPFSRRNSLPNAQ
ncbi:hypothetical protein K437DRAFT_269992 [Tilletiaria anomala UBC 951]|uniref:Zn(2)-C6 fungal-type domain-containing protein n=1 Tax=Tilletiaria anomala (strain ATCC 24038 / CBS 436.72 / UBC 951) TaxID=1037660 RepID=A0A066VG51_TILAU|nr:uncharacterized protein K437DRAFT_269992 [Tilletiaria anomala UBC 951]KDN40441.1 hypothetical protein K437DRAFT_269992 [Tilletiaria anomala UBC 951]